MTAKTREAIAATSNPSRPPPANLIVLTVAFLGAVLITSEVSAGQCKPGGSLCQSSQSCCSGECVKPTLVRGKAVFGTCTAICEPTTCVAEGADCGTIDDGCAGTLDCGSCSAPDTCGGAGTPNVCGCTPTTCADLGYECGSADDGCGATLDCAGCTEPETCGGGGTENVCGSRTCTPGRPGCAWQQGDAITYVQAQWGTSSGGTAVDLLNSNYSSVYAPTSGVLEVGIAGSAGFSMRFTGSANVASYLPAGGAPGPLTSDRINPTVTESGAFGGERSH